MRAFRFWIVAASLVAGAAGQQALVAPALLPGAAGAGAAPAAQLRSEICAGAGAALVVWEDHRSAATGVSMGSDVFAIRVDSAGAPLDPVALALDVAPGNQSRPLVAWNGAAWLVVWTSEAAVPGFGAPQLRATRVDANGVMLDQPPLVLADYALQAADLKAIAANGTEFLVAAEGSAAGGAVEIRGFRVGANGAVLNPGGTPLVTGGGSLLFNPTLASAGGQYLLAYDDYAGATGWDVRARRFDAALAPLDAAPFSLVATAGTDSRARLASDGGAYYLVWESANAEVRGSRVTLAGAKLDGASGAAVSGPTSWGPRPTIAWDGAYWYAAWGSLVPQVARIAATGAVLDPGGTILDAGVSATKSEVVVAAASGGGALVSWTDARVALDGTDVYGCRVDASGASTVAQPWSLAAAAQTQPRAAFGPGYGLIVYRRTFSGASEIRATRVDAFGAPLDADSFVVGAGPSVGVPAVAWNGSLFLVAWDAGENVVAPQIRARRLGPDGVFIDAAPFVVTAGFAPDVAAVGDTFLVSAVKQTGSWPIYRDAIAVRVRGSDATILDPQPLYLGGSYARDPRATAVNGGFYVVWAAAQGSLSTTATITGAFVPTVGPVGAVSGLALSYGGAHYPSAASAGSDVFVAWSSGSNHLSANVYAMRVPPTGPTGAVIDLGLVPGGRRRPATAFDGENFVVAWEDYRANTDVQDQRGDLYATRVSPAGVVLDPAGFPAATPAGPASQAFVAGAGFGRCLLGAATFETDAAFGTFRVRVGALRPAGLAAFGAGTPGCAGPSFLDGAGVPQTGSSTFGFVAVGGPPFGESLLLLGSTPDLFGSDPFAVGVTLHVAPLPGTFVVVPFLRDGAGVGFVPAAIPPGPLFVGYSAAAQAIDLWPATLCTPTPLGLASSHGLAVVVQN